MNFSLILANTRSDDIEETIKSFTVDLVLISALLLIVLLVIAVKIVANKKFKALKKPLFVAIAAIVIVPSLYMTGSTIYLNTVSDSKGPVHWHTDIEFWVCGQEIEFRDPIGALNNKIGTSTFHEHNDKRLHLEGVVFDASYDATLGKFMTVTGGDITKDSIVIPTEDSLFENDIDGDKNTGDQDYIRTLMTRDDEQLAILDLQNGMSCNEDIGYAELQVFQYTFNKSNDTYSQQKLSDPALYSMRDESVVPPGDCLIVEFDTVKDATDKLCQQFGVSDVDRCTEFGVSEFNPKVCKIRQVPQQSTNQQIEEDA